MDGLDGEVEVVIRPLRSESEAADLGAVVHALPMGALTKDEIDQELARDRAEWNDR